MFIKNILYQTSSTDFEFALIIGVALLLIYLAAKVHTSKTRGRDVRERYAMQQGAAGESAVSSILSRLPKSQYKVINDVLIAKGSNTTQIDHVIVSSYGIFVIETKNYTGCLVGDEFDEHMDYYVGENRLSIYNPLKQNRSHVYSLMNALNISFKSSFIPILALSNNCQFEITTDTDVVHFSSLFNTILQYRTVVFSKEEMEEITERIKELNIVDRKERRRHIERVNAYVQSVD